MSSNQIIKLWRSWLEIPNLIKQHQRGNIEIWLYIFWELLSSLPANSWAKFSVGHCWWTQKNSKAVVLIQVKGSVLNFSWSKKKSQTAQRLIPDSVGELPLGLLLQIAAQNYTVWFMLWKYRCSQQWNVGAFLLVKLLARHLMIQDK